MTTTLTRKPATAPKIFAEVGVDFVAHYREFGFALLGEALSQAEVAELNADAERLCRGE